MDDFLQKLKKVIHIVLYGPAISQSDSMEAGPNQLPSIKIISETLCKNWERQSTNRELLQAQQCYVCDIKM